MAAVDTTPIIDVDSHISEPPDLWTSRVSRKYVDQVPVVRFNPALGVDDWFVGDLRLVSPGFLAMAGHNDYQPNIPATYADFDPGAWQPEARLRRLDEFGVHAQVLFPNVLAFYSWAFMAMKDKELVSECFRAYNEFAAEFASTDPNRLIPLCVTPFWDLDEAIRQLRHAHEIGHRGLVFGWDFEHIGLPRLVDPHWDPLLKVAEELDMPINLHIGASTPTEQNTSSVNKARNEWDCADYAKKSALVQQENLAAIAELTTTGIVERYPKLKWISVESGFGYIPYLLEALDWQWSNSGAARQFPNKPIPSETFRQSVYGSFWFERESMALLGKYPDNIMFETDYPHPTSLSPGPATVAKAARVTVKESLAEVPEDVVRKVLFDNAAALFKVSPPATEAK